ncbi:hypothetical protein BG000_000457 [Podila horticola]|nr:hypothetical protein BG000_000457 [Podila horticola]
MSHNYSNDPNRSTAPLPVPVPRRGSLSSSFALATSPRTFAAASNPFLSPMSPTSSSTQQAFGSPPANLSTSIPTSSSGSSSPPGPGILRRRFSIGFNPHSQIIPSSQDNSHGSATAGATTAGGLFRKFSIGGGGGGGGLVDKNSTEDMHQQQHPRSSIFAALQSHKHKDSSADQQQKQDHLTTVQHLKAPNQEKNSRSSSPMRSMILNGQMLD